LAAALAARSASCLARLSAFDVLSFKGLEAEMEQFTTRQCIIGYY
jgi:hypothetical protein